MGPTGNILELHLSQGLHKFGSVFHVPVDGFDRLHNPPCPRIRSLRVIRSSLFGLLTEGFHKFLIDRIVQHLAVMKGSDDSEDLIPHGRKGMFIGQCPIADQREFPLETELLILFIELHRLATREGREDRISVLRNLRDVRTEILGRQGDPYPLKDLSPRILKNLMKTSDTLPSEGEIIADQRDLPKLKNVVSIFSKGLMGLTTRPPGPDNPLGNPSLVISSADMIG